MVYLSTRTVWNINQVVIVGLFWKVYVIGIKLPGSGLSLGRKSIVSFHELLIDKDESLLLLD